MRQPNHRRAMASRQKEALLREYSGVLYAFQHHPERTFRHRGMLSGTKNGRDFVCALPDRRARLLLSHRLPADIPPLF